MGVTGLVDALLLRGSGQRDVAAIKAVEFLQEVVGVSAGVDLSYLLHHDDFVREFGALVLAGKFDDPADFLVHWANAVTFSGATLVFVADNRDMPYPPKGGVDDVRASGGTTS